MKADNRYQQLLNSPLYKISDPGELDDFLAEISDRADQQWYLRDFTQDIPVAPAIEKDVQEFIIQADALLQKSLKQGATLTLEVDDTTIPTFIKLHSDISLNGNAAEDWTLSLDMPSANSGQLANTPVMEKGGPLLKWFSSKSAPNETSELADPDAPTATNEASPVLQTPAAEEVSPIETRSLSTLAEEEIEPVEIEAEAEIESEIIETAEPQTPAPDMLVDTDKDEITQPTIEVPETDEKPAPGYLEQFDGRLIAIRKWNDLDQLWAGVHGTAGDGWYIYTLGEKPPTVIEDSQTVHRFLLDVDKTLRKEHKEDYCGIVYADNTSEPTFIKIYDPHNLGMVCGSSDTRTLPGWTISRTQPVELRQEPDNQPEKGGFLRWKGFFKRR